MQIKDMKKEDLEVMAYDDLAYLILREAGSKMKINDLFKEVCNILDLSNEEFENKIADFFELLSTEKRFVMLENGYWDLRDNHSQKIIIDEDDDVDDEEVDFDDPVDNDVTDDSEEIFDDNEDEDIDDNDDLKNFAVIDEDDEENTNIE